MRKKQSKGFTLLELLVVIAIVAILSAIVLTAMSSARSSGRDGRRLEDIHQLQNALEIYYSTNKAYPATLSALAPSSISSIPTDPTNSGAFVYWYIPLSTAVSGAPCNGYHLAASLELSNKVLTTDSDVNSSTITSGSALKCLSTLVGPNGGNGAFPTLGTSESTKACDGSSSGYCYDILNLK